MSHANRLLLSQPLAALMLAFLAGFARADVVDPLKDRPGGELHARFPDGRPAGVFPLEHTKVDAQVSGFIARVDVVQSYENPFDHSIEAIYTFPLPHDAAVDDMTMRIGDRTIKGVIKKKAEAEAVYKKARETGQTASLLTQERPNIFTQAVANIHPGDRIEIHISYVDVLSYESSRYDFRFPMVVGPRFIPGTPVRRPSTGTGFAPDTDVVPDASRITPPVLPPGIRTGHDIDVRLTIDAGVPIQGLECLSHQVQTQRPSNTRAVITLAQGDRIPNKDLVVRFRTAGARPELAVLAQKDGAGPGSFMLIAQPHTDFTLREITGKEMVFVVDNSGSMSGRPMAAAD